jgi:hypothetical protein
VNGVVDFTGVQYAVIAGLRTETGPERLVIAYPNEESLRDLIAAPSIIAAGFSSHEEALAGSRASVEAITSKGIKRYRHRLKWAEYPKQTASTIGRLAKFLVTSYKDVATTAIVIFSSTNAFSSVVRMALGSSV